MRVGEKKKKKIAARSSGGGGGGFLCGLLCASSSYFDAMNSASEEDPESSSLGAEQDLRTELLETADLLEKGEYHRADEMIARICSKASLTSGDAAERVVAQFGRGLALRRSGAPRRMLFPRDKEWQGTLYMNQVTPFVRFCHLTANQTILDGVDPSAAVIHVVDVAIQQGVQWPPFMQALAERPGGGPRLLRITGLGTDLESLRCTGRRLERFAATLGLPFEFQPYAGELPCLAETLVTHPNESLAINCVLRLHDDSQNSLIQFLHGVRGLSPAVLALAEREADHDDVPFLPRFNAALSHYSSLFDSLEATLPPKSQERFQVENACFGREIAEIVAGEGSGRTQRHRRFSWWCQLLGSCGYQRLRLSEFAVSQARLLLRLHYPSEGYQLHYSLDSSNCIYLGWQGNPIFTVSSWH